MSSLPVATSQIEPSSGVVKGLGDPAGAEIGFAECDDPRCLIEEQLPSPSEFDGGLQKGLSRSYTDNGDGTITDNRTGLTWEKLSDDGSIHDWDNTYSWATAFSGKVATLNSTSFAGHADWRLPNVNELQSLIDYGTVNPAVSSAFNSGCAPGCTVTTCSCTRSASYWPSTSSQSSPTLAWTVFFGSGLVGNSTKSTSTFFARAVRGGS